MTQLEKAPSRPFDAKVFALFWSKVIVNGASDCWPWRAGLTTKGYGNFSLNGIHTHAHRVAYWLAIGEIPINMFVCHGCDNRKCCNPSHLFLGTDQDNTIDMVQKGRHGMAKLNCVKVKRIRALLTKMTGRNLAKMFNVHEGTIRRIKHRHSWGHVL